MIKVENVVEHLLSLHSRTLRVELDGLDVVVDSHLPVASLPILVSFFIVFLCSHYYLGSIDGIVTMDTTDTIVTTVTMNISHALQQAVCCA